MANVPFTDLGDYSLEKLEQLTNQLGLHAAEAPAIPDATEDFADARISYGQSRLWFLDRFTKGGSAYNVARAYRVLGRFDAGRMQRAVQAVYARHEALRTYFPAVDGRPVPVLGKPEDCELELGRCSTLELPSWLAQQARQPFDLETAAPFRCVLLQLADDEHVFFMNVHHINFDGHSMQLFLREVSSAYDALAGEAPLELAPAAVQPRHFASWQKQREEGEAWSRAKAHWLKELEGAPALVEIPADHQRAEVARYVGRQLPFRIGGDVRARLNAVGRQSGASPFMVVAAVFAVLLGRYSGQDEVVFGIPMTLRQEKRFEKAIGCFINMLPIRLKVELDAPFSQLLGAARHTCLAAYSNGELPFEKTVEALNPMRRVDVAPVFQHVIEMHDKIGDLELTSLTTERIPLHSEASRFDFTISLEDDEDGYAGEFEYSSDLFDPGTAKRILDTFLDLVRQISLDPQRRVTEYSLLAAEDRQLQAAWNGTDCPQEDPPLIHERFAEVALRYPDKPAIVFGETQLSYRELQTRANEVCARLQACGVGRGSRVAVMLPRNAELIVALLGVLQAGAAYVPIDPALPPFRTTRMLDNAQPIVLFTRSDALGTGLDDVACKILLADGEDLPALASPHWAPGVPASGSDPAYLIYTSGSTGQPKGVVVSHANVTNFLSAMRKRPGLNAEDRVLALTTVSFDIAVLELFLPLTTGATVVLASDQEAKDGRALRALIERSRPTLMQATPASWRLLLESGWAGDRQLVGLCGGEALPAELARALLERLGSLWNMYGPTETTVWSTLRQITSPEQCTNIGRPIDNTTIQILSDFGQSVPIGVAGEICVGGAGVSLGYWGLAEETQLRFRPDNFVGKPGRRLYRTGDRGRWLIDGTIQFLGRIDNQVKVRGYRIELGEVEDALLRLPDVAAAAATTYRDASGELALVGYVELTSPTPSAELRRQLAELLPPHVVPTLIVSVDALPLTANGKLDRKRLPSPDRATATVDSQLRPPSGPTECLVASVFVQLLPGGRASASQNFFDSGGHSLLASIAVARLAREAGVDITLLEFFKAPTVEALAALIDRQSPAVAARGANPQSSLMLAVSAPEFRGFHLNCFHHCLFQAINQRQGRDIHALNDYALCFFPYRLQWQNLAAHARLEPAQFREIAGHYQRPPHELLQQELGWHFERRPLSRASDLIALLRAGQMPIVVPADEHARPMSLVGFDQASRELIAIGNDFGLSYRRMPFAELEAFEGAHSLVLEPPAEDADFARLLEQRLATADEIFDPGPALLSWQQRYATSRVTAFEAEAVNITFGTELGVLHGFELHLLARAQELCVTSARGFAVIEQHATALRVAIGEYHRLCNALRKCILMESEALPVDLTGKLRACLLTSAELEHQVFVSRQQLADSWRRAC